MNRRVVDMSLMHVSLVFCAGLGSIRAAGLPEPLLHLYERMRPLTGWAQSEEQKPHSRAPRPQNADDPVWVVLDGAYRALREQELDEAIAGFERAVALAPRRTDIRKDLAYTYLRTGQNELARRQFAAVALLDPEDEVSQLELAFLDYESLVSENRSEAWRIFRRLKEHGSESARRTAQLAFDNIDRALGIYITAKLQVFRDDPGNPFVAFELGVAYHERNAFADAVTWYRRAIRSGQSHALLRLGEVLLHLNQPGQAMAAFESAAVDGDGFVSEEGRERLWQLRGR